MQENIQCICHGVKKKHINEAAKYYEEAAKFDDTPFVSLINLKKAANKYK